MIVHGAPIIRLYIVLTPSPHPMGNLGATGAVLQGYKLSQNPLSDWPCMSTTWLLPDIHGGIDPQTPMPIAEAAVREDKHIAAFGIMDHKLGHKGLITDRTDNRDLFLALPIEAPYGRPNLGTTDSVTLGSYTPRRRQTRPTVLSPTTTCYTLLQVAAEEVIESN